MSQGHMFIFQLVGIFSDQKINMHGIFISLRRCCMWISHFEKDKPYFLSFAHNIYTHIYLQLNCSHMVILMYKFCLPLEIWIVSINLGMSLDSWLLTNDIGMHCVNRWYHEFAFLNELWRLNRALSHRFSMIYNIFIISLLVTDVNKSVADHIWSTN